MASSTSNSMVGIHPWTRTIATSTESLEPAKTAQRKSLKKTRRGFGKRGKRNDFIENNYFSPVKLSLMDLIQTESFQK